MLPNLSVIWVIFFVLLMTVVLDRMLLRPVLEVIRKREEAATSARDLAAKSSRDAQAAVDEFDRKTGAARAELYKQMDDMRRGATGRRDEIVAQTRAEAEAQVAVAVRQLDDQAAAARRQLGTDAQALGEAAADRILGRRAS